MTTKIESKIQTIIKLESQIKIKTEEMNEQKKKISLDKDKLTGIETDFNMLKDKIETEYQVLKSLMRSST